MECSFVLFFELVDILGKFPHVSAGASLLSFSLLLRSVLNFQCRDFADEELWLVLFLRWPLFSLILAWRSVDCVTKTSCLGFLRYFTLFRKSWRLWVVRDTTQFWYGFKLFRLFTWLIVQEQTLVPCFASRLSLIELTFGIHASILTQPWALEFYAVVKGGQVGLALRSFHQDLRIPIKVEIQSYSSTSNSLTDRLGAGQRTKHIDTRYFWIQERVQDGHLVISYKYLSNSICTVVEEFWQSDLCLWRFFFLRRASTSRHWWLRGRSGFRCRFWCTGLPSNTGLLLPLVTCTFSSFNASWALRLLTTAPVSIFSWLASKFRNRSFWSIFLYTIVFNFWRLGIDIFWWISIWHNSNTVLSLSDSRILNLYRLSRIWSDGIIDIDNKTSSHLVSNSWTLSSRKVTENKTA